MHFAAKQSRNNLCVATWAAETQRFLTSTPRRSHKPIAPTCMTNVHNSNRVQESKSPSNLQPPTSNSQRCEPAGSYAPHVPLRDEYLSCTANERVWRPILPSLSCFCSVSLAVFQAQHTLPAQGTPGLLRRPVFLIFVSSKMRKTITEGNAKTASSKRQHQRPTVEGHLVEKWDTLKRTRALPNRTAPPCELL